MKPGARCVIQFSDADRWINRLAGVLFRIKGRHYRPTKRREVMAAAKSVGLHPIAERSHLLVLPGMQRLLGRWLVPYDRLTRKLGYGLDTLMLLERHAAIVPKVFQVPGEPAVVQTHPIVPAAAGAEL
jgi:hypothetical protein